MELAIASGVAALGYGITKMFPRDQDAMTMEENGDELATSTFEPVSSTQSHGSSPAQMEPNMDQEDDLLEDDPKLDGYTEFQNRLPPIDPKYRPSEVVAFNGDVDDLPDGTLGIPRENLPYFRESNRAQSDAVTDRKRDLYTGGTQTSWKPKQEVKSMFEPQQGIAYVYGAPVKTTEMMNSYQDRTTTMYRNGELLFDPERVGPGLGVGPDAPAAYGFHDPVRVLPFNVGASRRELPGRSNLGKRAGAGDRPMSGRSTRETRERTEQMGRVGGATLPIPMAELDPATVVGQDKVNLRTGEIPMNRVGGAGHVGISRGGYEDVGDYTKNTTVMRVGEIPLSRVGGAGHAASSTGGYTQEQDYTKETTTVRMGEIEDERVGGASRKGVQGHAPERGEETMERTKLRMGEIPLARVGVAGQSEKAQGAYTQEQDHTKVPSLKRNAEVPLNEVGGANREGVGDYANRAYLVPHTQRGTEHRGVNPAGGTKVFDPTSIGKARLRDHQTIDYTPGPQLPNSIPFKGQTVQTKVKKSYNQPIQDLANASRQLHKNPLAIRPLHEVK